MDATAVSFLSGVALAIVGLSINEAVSFQIKSYRLRKVLIADADSTVAGLTAHLATLPAVEAGLKDGSSASFIWEGDSAGSAPTFLGDVPVYLTTAESSLALNFYSAQGRIDSIRAEFNSAVRSILTEKDKRDAFTEIAIACLHDLEKNYGEASKAGLALSALVKKNVWDDGGDV